ncbi:MAG: ribonuclease III [Gammaproteobacteria bacterium]|nr:ribonuclease III [Gammaproteobacteria bacterium]
MSDGDLDKLELRLGYKFADKALLLLALTHRGISGANNERLEFLGDAALGLAVAELLYQRYPDVQEHHLSLMRANVVNRDALAVVAREIDLGDHLRLGQGELRSGGFRRASILSNTLEAILGAALIDGGVDAVRDLVGRLLAGRLDDDAVTRKDPKTRLQELMQARRMSLPVYQIKAQDGEAHQPVFLVECWLEELDVRVEARAGSRRDAEKAAAQRALDVLGDQP